MIILLSSCNSKQTEETLNQRNNEIIDLNNKIKAQENQITILKDQIQANLGSYKSIIEELESESKRISEEYSSFANQIDELATELVDANDINNKLKDEAVTIKREIESYETIWYESDRLINISRILVMNIGINDTKEQVIQVLGDDFEKGYWKNEHSVNLEGEHWIYKGIMEISFFGDKVVEILAYGKDVTTSFNVSVGDNYYKSIVKLSLSLDGYVSIHSINGNPNRGWFVSDKDEIIILSSVGNGVSEEYVNMIHIKSEDIMVD